MSKKRIQPPIWLYLLGGSLSLCVAGFYGSVEKWANFAFSLSFANILLICGLLESQYRRTLRRLEELKSFINQKCNSGEQKESTRRADE